MNNPSKVPVIGLSAVGLLFWLLGYAQSTGGQETDEELSIGERFHEETSITWRGIVGDLFRSKPKNPPPFKSYPKAERVKLPKADYLGMTVEEALKKRRSRRNYTARAMSMSELSQLLFAAQGITGKTYERSLRTAPSAGGLYPYEIYVVVMNVDGLDEGIYHYSVRDHQLEKVKSGDFRGEIATAALEQEMMGDADIALVLSAIVDRTRHKYGERGFRYIYMEAGHISQNIYLQAVSLKLGSVAIGAFHDDKLNELIGVNGRNEMAIYMQAVGTR